MDIDSQRSPSPKDDPPGSRDDRTRVVVPSFRPPCSATDCFVTPQRPPRSTNRIPPDAHRSSCRVGYTPPSAGGNAMGGIVTSPQKSPSQRVQEEMRVFIKNRFKQLVYSSKEEASKELLACFRRCGVKMIASDFDLTMITVHSSGLVNKKSDERGALTAMSSDFNHFATSAHLAGFKLSVVTFSDRATAGLDPQTLAGESLVAEVLRRCGAEFDVQAVYGFLPSNYRDPYSYRAVGLEGPMSDNKSYHLGRLCRDFGLNKQEVILIDDTKPNCLAALQEGYLALHVTGDHGFDYATLDIC